MDWLDPQYATTAEKKSSGRRRTKSKRAGQQRRKSKSLATQANAALAQPLEVWSVAFDHQLAQLSWPKGCSRESSFLWSALIEEQAEVLVRAGLSAKRLASIVSESDGDSDENRAKQLSSVVGLMDQPLEKLAFEWLEESQNHAHAALGVIAFAWEIPEHARRSDDDWISNWVHDALDRIATFSPDPLEEVICNLVLQCELPLLLGVATTPSKRTAIAEATRAMDYMAEYLERSEDNSGPWLVHGATYLRAALACILRCRVLADALGLRGWFTPQQKAIAGLLKHAARWCRPDGTQLLAAGNNAPRSKAMWRALIKQTKNPKPLAAALTLSGVGSGKRSEVRKTTHSSRLPALTHYSHDASTVSMQSDWKTKGSRVAIDFSDTNICLEALGPKGNPLLAGEWTVEVSLDGQAQPQDDEWQEVCWFSDDDVDYLELDAPFGEHARIQRQAVLFRSEHMLLLADALLGTKPGAWSVRSQIPLAANTFFDPAKKTTEGTIHGTGKTRSLVLPLYLPEWRRQLSQTNRDDTCGLSMLDEELVATLQANTKRLYMPTLIGLHNSNPKLPFTWRHLTVGDELRIVEPDEAVAYRVQIGPDQWVLYRSLDTPTRRTALGMHTLADFYAGRFDAEEGEVDTIVEVEASDS